MKAWKVLQSRNGEPAFIIRGLKGSKDITLDVELVADVRRVRDGSGKRWYLSGFHIYADRQVMNAFVRTLKITDGRYAVRVHVNELRPKHERSKASLSTTLMVSKRDWSRRIPLDRFVKGVQRVQLDKAAVQKADV